MDKLVSPNTWFFPALAHSASCIPRAKIDSIIAKSSPHPDPDAPDDCESVRFWCRVGATHNERERTSLTATAQASLTTTGENLSSMLTDLGSAAPEVPCGNRPALKQLVDLATADPAPTAPKAKAKGKAKAKARVQQQTPKTPAEQRTAIRFLFLHGDFWFWKNLSGACGNKH